MPLRLDIKRSLIGRSQRVKCVDVHPQEPWVLSALYTGHVMIWNYDTQVAVRTFELSDNPVRSARFVVRKNWIICGSDDMQIRVYNYNTFEKVRVFEAHTDYIRSLAVHPTLPFLLSASDDMSIKLWDWDSGWENTTIFEGHTHYVMHVEFNPKDPNTFASASLDRTVKVWMLTSSIPNFELDGHEAGVNCVSYFQGGDKPFLVSGADDNKVRVWDYQVKVCVAVLEGHNSNISAVCFHPDIPIIISGSEDSTIRIWHSGTYRLENTLNYGLERVWSLGTLENSNKVAIGYDEGTIMISLGQEEPVVSMDPLGKVVWAKTHDIHKSDVVRALKSAGEVQDGDIVCTPHSSNDAKFVEVYPQSISHNSKGRLVTICGDGEYTIYTAIKFKNKKFGPGLQFVWSDHSANWYATRESSTKVVVFQDFEEHQVLRPNYAVESIFGGHLLGVRSKEFICFYDWEELRLVRLIEIVPEKVYWAKRGDCLTLVCEGCFYFLRYNKRLVQKLFDRTKDTSDEGIEDAFVLEGEPINETVTSGQFEGEGFECFLFTNNSSRLNYYIGGQVITLAHLDRPMYLLGYIVRESRCFLIDKNYNIVTYELLFEVLAFQHYIVRSEIGDAIKLLESRNKDTGELRIPKSKHNNLAQFLDKQDLKELALEISSNPEHKFELALGLKQLDVALAIVEETCLETGPAPGKYKQLGELALQCFDLKLAEHCATQAEDLSSLLLLYTSTGSISGLEKLAEMANKSKNYNVSFLCLFLLHRVEDCINLLLKLNRAPEAALMARAYCPTIIPKVMKQWKEQLMPVSEACAGALCSPDTDPDKFPMIELQLTVQNLVKQANVQQKGVQAGRYTDLKNLFHADYMAAANENQLEALLSAYNSGAPPAATHKPVAAEETRHESPPIEQKSPMTEETVEAGDKVDDSPPQNDSILSSNDDDILGDDVNVESIDIDAELNSADLGDLEGEYNFDDDEDLDFN